MSTLLTKEVNAEIRSLFKSSRDAFVAEQFRNYPVHTRRDIVGDVPFVFYEVEAAIKAGATISPPQFQPLQATGFIIVTVDRPQEEIDAERVEKEMKAEEMLKSLITGKVLDRVKAQRAKEAEEAAALKAKEEAEEQARLDMDEATKISLAIDALFKDDK